MIANMYPYIVTNGNGQEAVTFYETALSAKVLNVQTFANMPENKDNPIPEEAKNLVLNAHLKVGDVDLMLSDTLPGQPYQVGDQVSIAITLNDPEKTKTVFEKLSDGGNVNMPLQETFWSPAYGQVTDKFGVLWQISTEGEQA